MIEFKPSQADTFPDFGDYVVIEQYRYGVENEHYLYKVLGKLESNTWRPVPFKHDQPETVHGRMEVVLNGVCCGVGEDTIERVALKDCQLNADERFAVHQKNKNNPPNHQ